MSAVFTLVAKIANTGAVCLTAGRKSDKFKDYDQAFEVIDRIFEVLFFGKNKI